MKTKNLPKSKTVSSSVTPKVSVNKKTISKPQSNVTTFVPNFNMVLVILLTSISILLLTYIYSAKKEKEQMLNVLNAQTQRNIQLEQAK